MVIPAPQVVPKNMTMDVGAVEETAVAVQSLIMVGVVPDR